MCDPSGYDASRYANACTVCARAVRVIRAAEQKGEEFGGISWDPGKTQFWVDCDSKEAQEYTVKDFEAPSRSAHDCGGISYRHFDAVIGRWNEIRGPDGCKRCKEVCSSLLDKKGNAPPSHVDPYLVMSYCQSKERWYLSAWEFVLCLSPTSEPESGWKSKTEIEFVPMGKETTWQREGSPHLDNAWINTDQIRSWIDTCHRTHQEPCSSSHILSSWTRELRSLLLIDVEQKCLIKQAIPCKYVALSYVWGKHEHVFQTTKATLSRLSKKGAFQEHSLMIPRTVRDSMTFTKAIGQRYLWVDRFSIIQDDETDVHTQINAMVEIYANSYVTIVAEAGNNDAYGLRGMRGSSTLPRKLPWRQLRFGDTVQFISSHRIAARRQTQYYKRAWTLQEYEMSLRKVIFSQGSISWSCRVHAWEECSISPRKLQNRFYDDASSPERPLQWYCRMVESYNYRLLTNANDALRAFSSIIATASRSLVDGITYGIPEVIFDAGIMWEPGIIEYDPLRRRVDSDGREQHQFPTWSWIGWHGHVCIQYWRLTVEQIYGCCEKQEWYKTLQAVTWFKRKRAAIESRDYRKAEESDDKHGTSRPLIPGDWVAICPREYFLEQEGTLEEHDDNKWSPIIYARTSRAFMQIGQRLEPSQYGPAKNGGPARGVCATYITNATGDISGVLLLNSLDDIPVGKSCELIYVSKARIDYVSAQGHFDDFPELFYFHGDCEPACWLGYGRCRSRHPESGYYTFYNVLSIEWRDGIAYRVTCGRVFGDAWDAAEKEEVDLFLG